MWCRVLVLAQTSSSTSFWQGFWVGVVTSIIASVIVAAAYWLYEWWRTGRAAAKFRGSWDMWTLEGRAAIRDKENCTVQIWCPNRLRPDSLHVKATHSRPNEKERNWEGMMSLNRSVPSQSQVAWQYTDQTDEYEFGVYQFNLRGNGEILAAPDFGTFAQGSRKFILKPSPR